MTVTSKLSTEVLKKAMENSISPDKALQQPGESPFHDLLQSTQEAYDFADLLGVGEYQLLPDGKVQAMSAETIPFDLSKETDQKFAPTGGDKVVHMLADFNEQQMHMDNLINEIMYGEKKFSNQELLAIQAHVFHVAQMTEMTVKAAELTVTSFKGVMNTQIQ
ncbi:MAG: hypothetical protein HY609_04250 [Deltaproteobacteria bacterium]|nr:hypothetical protein [Deltaproteobacteria bacterium]MBI4224121.1 hypothetical protein [Deltaproteobacteria bacterium]